MMRVRFLNPGQYAVASLLLCAGVCAAQAAPPKSAQEGKPQTHEQVTADAHKLPAERGEVIDRIVAIVNGDLVLESDVDEEERFTKLYPYGQDDTKPLREQAITRLIDRTLLQQQLRGFPSTPVTEDEITKEEADLRKDLPQCAHQDCSTDAGWTHFLESMGFTRDELRNRLKQRAQVLRFVEQRFRSAVSISGKQVEDYYTNTLLPQYAKQNATAPPLDSIRDRVEEILLQQQVSSLLDSWLKTLRESGHVRMMQQDVEAP